MYHDKQTSHSSQVLISYFHLSRKLKTLNHVSRNNHFTPIFSYWIDLLSKGAIILSQLSLIFLPKISFITV